MRAAQLPNPARAPNVFVWAFASSCVASIPSFFGASPWSPTGLQVPCLVLAVASSRSLAGGSQHGGVWALSRRRIWLGWFCRFGFRLLLVMR